MLRVAIISDSHFDTSSRWEECLRIHQWIADDVLFRKVDLLLHAGDIFERKSNPQERIAVAKWLQKVAERCPVVMVKGNHDVLGDIEIFNRLETEHGITAVEDARVVTIYDTSRENGTLDRGPVIANVACVAWPRKAQLLAQVGDVSPEVAEQTAGDALRNVLRGRGMQMQNSEGPKILLMHAMVRGSKVSTGQPLVGCDMEIGIEDLGLANADFYALGHIHMPQEWEWNGAPIAYPGSPRRTAYGETEEKGYILAEFEQIESGRGVPIRWDVTWQRVPTPCTPMILLEADYTQSGDGLNENFLMRSPLYLDYEGADIRFRYHVPADQRDRAKDRARRFAEDLYNSGATNVTNEEVVIPQTRARTPEIATALTLGDKLNVLWKARNTVPEPPRAERLLSKVNDLETEARNVA